MGSETEIIKKPAPTFYAIIAIKLFKGLLFCAIAVTLYTISDNDLPADVRHLRSVLRLNPESKFWGDAAKQIGQLTEAGLIRAAAGIFIYSLFSLVEGIGLMFRVRWAGWMAIWESAFFIPIEVYELLHRPETGKGHPVLVVTILVINIIIVWYLLQNRHRLFKHHH